MNHNKKELLKGPMGNSLQDASLREVGTRSVGRTTRVQPGLGLVGMVLFFFLRALFVRGLGFRV